MATKNASIVLALILGASAILLPTASAGATGSEQCVGKNVTSPGEPWEYYCLGVHFNEEGKIDCIGSFARTQSGAEYCY